MIQKKGISFISANLLYEGIEDLGLRLQQETLYDPLEESLEHRKTLKESTYRPSSTDYPFDMDSMINSLRTSNDTIKESRKEPSKRIEDVLYDSSISLHHEEEPSPNDSNNQSTSITFPIEASTHFSLFYIILNVLSAEYTKILDDEDASLMELDPSFVFKKRANTTDIIIDDSILKKQAIESIITPGTFFRARSSRLGTLSGQLSDIKRVCSIIIVKEL